MTPHPMLRLTDDVAEAPRDGATPAGAAADGHAAAALTVASPHTVRPDLADQLAGNLRR